MRQIRGRSETDLTCTARSTDRRHACGLLISSSRRARPTSSLTKRKSLARRTRIKNCSSNPRAVSKLGDERLPGLDGVREHGLWITCGFSVDAGGRRCYLDN